MKRLLKWLAAIVGFLIVIGFLLFLYFIPPFTLAPAETFSGAEQKASPGIDHVAPGTDRLFAERGRYMVRTGGCTGCHVVAKPDGSPNWDRYLAGGARLTERGVGAAYSYNLTPDSATGLGSYSREEIVHILQTGQMRDGRIIMDHRMPWTVISRYSQEDLYAIATYLKALQPVSSKIPPPDPGATPGDPRAILSVSVSDHSEH
ncbi:MAG: hypothetical protein WB699_12155 [Bacteroidota bacterium]